MKTLFFVASFFIALASFAQTSVISVKSHQGTKSSIADASDHFGRMEPRREFDTIIRVDAHCVVQLGWQEYEGNRFRDTVCGHWYYEEHNYSEQKAQEFHGEHVLVIGFKKETNSIDPQDQPFGGRTRRQSFPLIFIILVLTGLGGYIASSFRTSKNNL